MIQMKIIDTLRKHLVELRDRFDPKKVREIKRIRDFKSKKIRVAIYTLIAVFSLGFGLVNLVKQEELSERNFRDQIVQNELKASKEEVANWNLVKKLPFKNSFLSIYQFQNKDGLNFLLVDRSTPNGQILEKTTIDTQKSEPKADEPIALMQLLVWLSDTGKEKKIDSYSKTESGWEVNGKEYKVELRYGQLIKVNDEELSRFPNLYLTQPAIRRILKSFEKNPEQMMIGRVTIEDGELLITSREFGTTDGAPVYEIRSNVNSEVKILENKIVKRGN